MLNNCVCNTELPTPGQHETHRLLRELSPRSHEHSAPAVHGSTDRASLLCWRIQPSQPGPQVTSVAHLHGTTDGILACYAAGSRISPGLTSHGRS